MIMLIRSMKQMENYTIKGETMDDIMIKIVEDPFEQYINEMAALAQDNQVQTKINKINGIVTQSKGTTVTELSQINNQLQTICNCMSELINTTAYSLQAIFDSFKDADKSVEMASEE